MVLLSFTADPQNTVSGLKKRISAVSFGAKICMDITFQLPLYIMKGKSQEDQLFCCLSFSNVMWKPPIEICSGNSTKWLFIHCFQMELKFRSAFVEGGKPDWNLEKNPRSKHENLQQTQPISDAGCGNQTRDTLVQGERSHHCAILAPILKQNTIS